VSKPGQTPNFQKAARTPEQVRCVCGDTIANLVALFYAHFGNQRCNTRRIVLKNINRDAVNQTKQISLYERYESHLLFFDTNC